MSATATPESVSCDSNRESASESNITATNVESNADGNRVSDRELSRERESESAITGKTNANKEHSKTGMEAADIVEDALQLAVDDELNEDRDRDLDKRSENERQKREFISTPKLHNTNDSSDNKSNSNVNNNDNSSLIVNVDDTSELELDHEFDVSNTGMNASLDNSKDSDAHSKQSNQQNANNDDKKESTQHNDVNTNNDESAKTNSSKDHNKDNENKESSKSKSAKSSKDSKTKSSNKFAKSSVGAAKTASNGRNIWVSGLSANATKASELHALFSKYGKVVSAKIIKNTRLKPSLCYGFITMENSEQCNKCITHINMTELHGRTISLSRNRPQDSTSKANIKDKTKTQKRETTVKKTNVKANETKKDKKEEKEKEKATQEVDSKTEETAKDKKEDKRKSCSKERSKDRSESRSHSHKPIYRDMRPPIRRPQFSSFAMRRGGMPPRRGFIPHNPSYRGFRRPIFARPVMRPSVPIRRIAEFDRSVREREHEKQIREERRRREEMFRVQRDMEREERIRFEKEKEKLKFERMKLEKEKADFFRYERERARLERERIEREREELQRRRQAQSQIAIQHRVEEQRVRPLVVPPPTKRPFESRDIRSTDTYWDERKRMQQTQRIESHIMTTRPYVEPTANTRHISHGYETRNDTYKRGRLEMPTTASSRSEFDARRHDSRHGTHGTGGHDRDERKGSATSNYYRNESSRPIFASRDRRLSSQRDDWKSPSHDFRRERYNEKAINNSNSSFGNTSRSYGSGDSRGWGDRSTSATNKVPYVSGNVTHFSGAQPWNSSHSSNDRWNSAVGSSYVTLNNHQFIV